MQQQVIQSQQYAVVQEKPINNGTRQIYFVGSNNSPTETVVEDNQSQPIVLNHQIGQNSTVTVRTPVQQLAVRGTIAGNLSSIRQQITQVT